MEILAAFGIVIACILVDFWIIMFIWLWRDHKGYTEPEAFFLIGFVVNTILLFLLLSETVANKMIQ